MRTCVVCRTSRPKSELIRVVRPSGGSPFLDPTGRANGRGAYVCRTGDCVPASGGRDGLARALRAPVPTEVRTALATRGRPGEETESTPLGVEVE